MLKCLLEFSPREVGVTSAMWIRSFTPVFLLTLGAACADAGLSSPAEDRPLGKELEKEPVKNPLPVVGPPGIYLANADGSSPARFLVEGDSPAWSPDGRSIAFDREDEIRVIQPGGATERSLSAGRDPSWSPDGTRIAFVGKEGIGVMTAEGSGATILLRHDFRNDTYAPFDMGIGGPAWSPDGERIAFQHNGDGDTVPGQVFLMNADGTAPRRVTPTDGNQYAESHPAWSPDGSQLVFWSYWFGLVAVDPAVGGRRVIHEDFPSLNYWAFPSWSPDGRTILFTFWQPFPQTPAVWAVDARGGPVRPVIASGTHAVWSPDGTTIAFVHPGSLNP